MLKKLKWIVLLLIVLIAGSLLIFALNQTVFSEQDTLFGNNFIITETMTMLLAFALAVPVILVILLVIFVSTEDKANTISVNAGAIDGTIVTSDGKSVKAAPTAVGESTPEESDGSRRFCMLSEIDTRSETYGHASYNKDITLEGFCNDFRNYAANRLKLYYDISDIRRFISGLALSHIIILQGMSGTGKTSLAHAFGSFIDNPSTIIPVQPMWKERTDLVGYYNEFTKKFNETLLLEKMYEANYSEDMYVTVLDEMNIARIEYYFAEFLSLLELPNADERYLDVVSDKWDNDPVQLKDGRIKLPPNMWFIGTANNDDSTFAISDKVYDRAMILNLDTKCERFAAPKTSRRPISAEQFEALVAEAVDEFRISNRNMKRLEQLDRYLIDHFHITFGNRIMKQIRTYIPVFVSCGGEELDALDDILSKKVIRKLETQNPIYLRNEAEGLVEYINELFGNDKMPLCKEYIHRLERNS